MTKKRRIKWMAAFIITALIGIFCFNFLNYYSLVEKEPSTMWGKELKIGEGDPKITPKIITEDDKILALYGSDGKFIIKEFDFEGKELKASNIAFDGESIRKLCFLKDGDNYQIVYSHDNINDHNLSYITIDSDFKEVKRDGFTGISDFCQPDSNNFLEYHDGKITWYDLKNHKTTEVPVDDVTYVLGAPCGNRFLISYINASGIYGLFVDENGTLSETKILKEQVETMLKTYENYVISGDSENCYIAYNLLIKGNLEDIIMLRYNFDNDKTYMRGLMVEGFENNINNLTGCSNANGARFFGTSDRVYIGKDVQTDILSFDMSKGNTINLNFASRMKDPSFSPYSEGDYMIYLNYNGKTYDVNMTSSNKSFKDAGSSIRIYDIKSALFHTVSGFVTGSSYMFVLGAYWIVPSLVVASIGGLIVGCKSSRAKKIYYVISTMITLAFKFYFVRLAIFTGGAPGYPDMLSKGYMVFIVCLISTMATYIVNYVTYNEGRDYVMVEKVWCPLFLDGFFSCLVFLPVVS